MTLRGTALMLWVTCVFASACGDDSAPAGGSGGQAGSGGMGGHADAATPDAPTIDAPAIDAALIDAPLIDAPQVDASAADASPVDAAIDAAGDLVCNGENYDVDGNPANGCEVADSPLGNHQIASAASLGSASCTDASSTVQISGHVPSDTRVHSNPTVPGFDMASGSAPDFFSIAATGGTFCVDDLALTFTVTGSSMPTCYQLLVSTNQAVFSCTASAAGTCTIIQGAGAYTDNSTILFEVKKLCSSAVHENASYAVTGHL